MHGKSFDPLHDLGAPLIHFDFTKVARTYRFPLKNTAQRTNDAIASSGALTNNAIRIKTGDAFSTTTFPDAGVVLIDSEYFSFSGYDYSGTDITQLNNVTRNIAGSIDSHSSGSSINLVAGDYAVLFGGTPGSGEGLRDFSDWTTDELQLKNEGSAGGYIEIPSDPLERPEGYNATGLGQLHRSCLNFEGSNDRMPLNSAITTTNGNFTVVFVHRPGDSPNQDCIIAGSSGGNNQIKINAKTLLFKFNSSGSANTFNQIKASNTTAYSVGSRGTPVDKDDGSDNSFLDNQSEFLALVKEKNATDEKEKVYLYDVQDLIGEDLINDSGTGGNSGYPDNSSNPTNTGFKVNHIGAFHNNNSDYTGEVAVITIYDRALSTAEIALLQEHYDNLYPSLHHE